MGVSLIKLKYINCTDSILQILILEDTINNELNNTNIKMTKEIYHTNRDGINWYRVAICDAK